MFKKTAIIISLLFAASAAQFHAYENHWFSKSDRATSEQVGYSDTKFLNASSGDTLAPATDNASIWTNCRGISADVGGIVKIDHTNTDGSTITEVLVLVSGIIRPVRNVTKLYRYYTGTTAGTAKSYDSGGNLITNAIKLHR